MSGRQTYIFHEIFSTEQDKVDWKDFCYHVARDHTYQTVSVKYLNMLDAFRAWRTGMTVVEETEEPLTEEKTEVEAGPFLRLVTGGKDGGGDGNWLASLEEGAIFLSRKKDASPTDVLLEQWHLQVKWGSGAILMKTFPIDGAQIVDMARFSKLNEYVETLRKRHPQED